MNSIIKTLTIAASTLVLTAGQTAHADSIGVLATSSVAGAFGGPVVTLTVTPNSESTMSTVSYTKQDFESEEGLKELYGLLRRASKNVCTGETSQQGRNANMKSSRLRCYRKSLSNAISEIDHQNLTRFHAG